MYNTEPFKLERQMIPLACQWLPAAIGINGPEWCSITEPMIGKIIPDILFGRLCAADVIVPTLTHIEASVLSLIHNETELTQADLLSQMFLPKLTATKTLRKLEKQKALQRTATGAFRVVENLAATQMEIVAVELKLKRWRKAISQAASYLTFADRAYAVLDGNQVKLNSKIISMCRDLHVGLVLQRGPQFQVITEADRMQLMTADRVLAARKLAKMALS